MRSQYFLRSFKCHLTTDLTFIFNYRFDILINLFQGSKLLNSYK